MTNLLRKQTLTSGRVFARVFLFCFSWMYFLMGLTKAINTFRHCLWFIANLRQNWSNLVETLPSSVNEDWRGTNNNVNVMRTDWFILTADFWLDEMLFRRLRKCFCDCDWMKFLHEFFTQSILSKNPSKYEINSKTTCWTITCSQLSFFEFLIHEKQIVFFLYGLVVAIRSSAFRLG